MTEIKATYITTRQPQGADPGQCEVGHFYIADGVVTMCSEEGRPTGLKRKLEPGEDARTVAGRLLREAWSKQSGGDFNRPLNYGPSGVV